MTRVRIGDERELLRTFLDQQRDVMLWKTDGLSDAQLRTRPFAGNGLYLLGLVKHLAATEQYWICELFGRPVEPISLAASDDVELDEDDTTQSVLAYFARARAASDEAMAEVDLETTAITWLGDVVTFRWAVLHVIEEAARHAGHADIIREHIDQATGHLPSDDLPY